MLACPGAAAAARASRGSYNTAMASRPRYTDEHAKAGLDFAFPAIETWQNQFPGYEIQIDDPELTSVCPKTGLPDFGVLTIRYMPRERCLELKSLKEYLFSYRNLGIFQENIVNQVLEDVVKACDPVWAVVKGRIQATRRHRHHRGGALAAVRGVRLLGSVSGRHQGYDRLRSCLSRTALCGELLMRTRIEPFAAAK